jgi:serine/threonine protein kinase
MSPQIIRQEKYTGLTDMWSLGVTFYFMMFKKLPWMAVHPVKILNEITIKINNGLVLPEENVSVVVSRLIERMLSIDTPSLKISTRI